MSAALQQAADATRQAVNDAEEAKARGAIVDAVISQKGGVGKSTITVNLAAVVGENTRPNSEGEDAPVVAAGIDPQGSMEKWADRVAEDRLPFDYLSTRGNNDLLPELKQDPLVRRIIVDCPGFMDVDPNATRSRDPLGHGAAADALRALLAITDRAIVPMNPEWLTYDPTEYTIERVLRPRGIPFLVVVNRWDARDGEEDLLKVNAWIDNHGYPRAPKPIRKYKIHTNAAEKGLVVTQYQPSGTALRAKEDFYKLALAVDGVSI
ncbi:ParA family protein [Nonomuraea sp. B19D2]|uniref:ParA family protein n=1 Tax=Nonomuraea sp. B19D2 TaxID=3159561 RepID=UPI0032DAC753